MNDKNLKKAKILTLIPVIVFTVTAICLTPLIAGYFSTGSDVTAIALIFAGTLSSILTTLPCLVMSVLGTVYAAKAKKEGMVQSRKFYVLGIIDIVIYGIGVLCSIAAVLLTLVAVIT